jgi:hypothetical protein
MISVFAGIELLRLSYNVRHKLFSAGVPVHPTRCNVGVALSDQPPQLLQLRFVLFQELQTGADNLVGAA